MLHHHHRHHRHRHRHRMRNVINFTFFTTYSHVFILSCDALIIRILYFSATTTNAI